MIIILKDDHNIILLKYATQDCIDCILPTLWPAQLAVICVLIDKLLYDWLADQYLIRWCDAADVFNVVVTSRPDPNASTLRRVRTTYSPTIRSSRSSRFVTRRLPPCTWPTGWQRTFNNVWSIYFLFNILCTRVCVFHSLSRWRHLVTRSGLVAIESLTWFSKSYCWCAASWSGFIHRM